MVLFGDIIDDDDDIAILLRSSNVTGIIKVSNGRIGPLETPNIC